jgi:hypothetical protein
MRASVLAIVLIAFAKVPAHEPVTWAVGVLVSPGPGPNPDPISRLTGSTNDTVKFTVKNSGTIDARYGGVCTALGNVSAITTCPTTLNGGSPIAQGDSVIVSVVFTAGAIGTGRVELKVSSLAPFAGAVMTGGWDITIVGPITVTPKDSLATSLPSSTNRRAVFRTFNNSSASTTYTFTALCSGIAPSCTPGLSRTSLLIAAHTSDTASIGYGVSATPGDTGRVRFIASAGGVSDTGSTRVAVTNAMATPVISTAAYNAGVIFPREECVTIALADDAAAECGDLRIVYQLPMMKVLNVVRRPTLIYNSATANPVPQVAIRVTVPSLTLVPDTVEAVLKVGATVRGRQRWAGVPWDIQGKPRYIRVRDTVQPALSTDLVNYTVEVTAIRSGSASLTATTSQQVLVVNRQASPYGKGWWLAGLEQLYHVGADTMVWVGGDGSARIYTHPHGSSGGWAAPFMTYPDSIKVVGPNYVRLLPDSVWVTFATSGNQISTRNRLGHTTAFHYDGSSRLDTLRLPSPGGLTNAWAFTYSGTGYAVTDGGYRPQTKVWLTSGRVDSIIGPRAPKDSVGFRYAGTTNIITRRIDRRGAIRRFDFDAVGKIQASVLGPRGSGTTDPLDTIVVALVPAEARGVSTAGSVDSIGLHTSYDGPRRPPPASGGAFDTTAFWVNRFGAPMRIVNALGDSLRLDRANATYPGLVTRLKSVTGQIMLATYDTVGRLRFVTDSSFAMATTEYRWHGKFDQLTAVIPPEKDSIILPSTRAMGRELAKSTLGVPAVKSTIHTTQ